MRSKFGDNEPQDVSYHGNAFLRLMGYIKPYWKTCSIGMLVHALLGFVIVFKRVKTFKHFEVRLKRKDNSFPLE